MCVDEAELPDGRIHGLLEDELLDPVQACLAALAIELSTLLAKQPVDVGIAAVDIRSAADREDLEPRGRVAEGAADAVGEILQLLLLVGLEERGALEWAELHADPDRLQIAHERLAHRRGRGLAPEISGVEAVGIARLSQELLGTRRIERVPRRLPEKVEARGNDAPGDPREPEREGLVDGLAIHRVVRGQANPPVGPR